MNYLWIFYLSIQLLHLKCVSAIVSSAPVITGPPSVNKGNSTALLCNATCSNNTACVYSWTGYAISTSLGTTINLDNVNETYNGKTYTCKVTDNGDDDVKSAEKILVVYYGPHSVSIGAGPTITVNEGEESNSKNLACKTDACNPSCSIYTWTKDGKNVSHTSKLFPTNTQISRSQSGEYTCTAGNGKTTPKSATILITVQYPPKVTLSWNKDDNTLKCTAAGLPAIYNFQQMKQIVSGVNIKNYGLVTAGDTGTLNLYDKDYQDTGTYECLVSNKIPDANSFQNKSFAIKVEDKPVLIDHEGSYNVSKGDRLTISMTLYAYPTADKAYIDLVANESLITSEFKTENVAVDFHGKMVTMEGQRLKFVFSQVLEDHFTTYTIHIANTVQNISTNVTIFPEGPPDIPSGFSISLTSPDSVTFKLVTGFYNGAGQTLVIEHKPEGNQSKWLNETFEYAGEEKDQVMTLKVQNLAPDTVYEFRAFAYNYFKQSEYTEIIKQKTAKAPDNTALIAGAVVGGIAFLVIVAIVVVALVVLYRRKQKEKNDGGTFQEQNVDITQEIPTSPVYENNHFQKVHTEEPIAPESPSSLYVNTNIAPRLEGTSNVGFCDLSPPQGSSTRDLTDASRSSPFSGKTGHYDNPRSNMPTDPNDKLELYDNPRSEQELYDIPRSKKNLYDSPRSKKELYVSPRSKKDLYDRPRLQASDTGENRNSNTQNGSNIPPYLELENPNQVEEAYLSSNQSKTLVQQSNSKSKLTGKGADLDQDYLDMNEFKKETNTSTKLSKDKESLYVNAQKTNKEYVDIAVDSGDSDYKNVAKYKKVKSPQAKNEKPYENFERGKEGYQNLHKLKKITQQPSVESNSGLYVTMSTERNRESIASLPEYHAPPPPEEENYMNIRVGSKK